MRYIKIKRDDEVLIYDTNEYAEGFNFCIVDNHLYYGKLKATCLGEIVEETDNLEELLNIVVETKGATGDYMHYMYWGYRYEELKPKIIDDMITQDFDVYGAIWTIKGLIYVAKMNNKGEFELCQY